MLISNFGLFWRVEDVAWGRQKQAGTLQGKLASAKRNGVVDFREQSGIYALYANYDLIYIGQTGSGSQKLLARLNQHRQHELAGRWNMFSWFGTRAVNQGGDLKAEKLGAKSSHQIVLNHLEAILIHVAEPALNRQGGKWGAKVEQYVQYRDEDRLGRPTNELIKEIFERGC